MTRPGTSELMRREQKARLHKAPPRGAARLLAMAAAFMLFASCSPRQEENKEKPQSEVKAAALETAAKTAGVQRALANPAMASPSVKSGDDRPDKPRKLTLIYTTAVSGELKDCGCPGHPRGGLARRAEYVKGMLGSGRAVLQVDAGDAFFPYRGANFRADFQLKKKAELIARVEAYLGLDAINIGGQDLAAGKDFLKRLQRQPEGTLPFISANLADSAGNLLFPPYLAVEKGGVKACITAAAGELYTRDNSITLLDPETALQNATSKMDADCDLRIALLSMDYSKAVRLAKQVSGIDIVIVSHYTASPRPRPLVAGNTIIVQAGKRGMFLGRMDLTLSPPAKGSTLTAEERDRLESELSRAAAQMAVLEGRALEDPDLKRVYEEAKKKADEIKARLAAARPKLDYSNSMVSMDLDLPEDQQVAKWVEEVLSSPSSPASLKGSR